jgi:hypothetical protein
MDYRVAATSMLALLDSLNFNILFIVYVLNSTYNVVKFLTYCIASDALQIWRSRIFEDANRGLTSKVPAHGTCYPFHLSLSHYHPAAGCIRPRRVIFH